ncbi:MAG: hypothetical protein A2157_15845 [Deltaproteobacteria bacterium RBG_16_47_11]|nr:MAG: hypothetical protein A2157_15845 [Deltaproteobacteria bacterium RBG_16_47_11]
MILITLKEINGSATSHFPLLFCFQDIDIPHEIYRMKRVACREAYLIDFDLGGGLKRGNEPL